MYQRESSAMPASWRDHPGKVWGHSRVSADWSVPGWRAAIPLDFDLDYGTGDSRGFWLYRRLARRWLLSKVVRFRDPKERAKQIAYTRRMLKCGLDANESVAGLDLNEPIPSESPESPESPGGVGVDPWDYPVPEHGLPTRIGEILDRELVGSHMKSDRRARNLWITGNANMQLLQWLADNADEIGCNVVQIGGDIPVLEGVPIVSEETE